MTRYGNLWLAHQYLPFALAAISMLLSIQSLWSGLALDDYFHKITVQGWPIHLIPHGLPFSGKLARPSMDIFSFLNGDPSQMRYYIDKGLIPWWAFDKVKLAFWRPVSAFTHWLDYRLWPNSLFTMHLHSLLWLGAAIVMVTIFYRRLIGVPWVAGLAALLYAIDDVHAIPASWLANRNVLIAVFFGVTAIIFHDRWRKDQRPKDCIFAALCLGAALLAKEAAVAVCGYLLTYALFLDHDYWQKRAASLVPYALVTAVWRMMYRAGGYGVWGPDWYIDPLLSPYRFLKNTIASAPKLLLGQFSLSVPDSLGLIIMRPWEATFLTVFFLLIAAWLWRDRLAWFWFSGMMLAVVPACTSLPNERILFFIGLGAMGLLAQLMFALSNSLKTTSSPSLQNTLYCTQTQGSDHDRDTRHAQPANYAQPANHHDAHDAYDAHDAHGARGTQRANRAHHGGRANHAHRTHRARCAGRALAYVICFFIIIIHLILAALLWPLKIYGFSVWSRAQIQCLETAPLDDTVSGKTVVTVNASGFYSTYLLITRALKGQPIPMHMITLASDRGFTVPIRISRPDECTLIVEPEGGYVWTFFRDGDHPLPVGSLIELPGMAVEVMKLAHEGWPQEVRYRFSTPLEDPSLVWLKIQPNTSLPFKLPAIGETLVLGGKEQSH
ncbi:MAG: hypothetical protein AB1847_12430 [bacterium]